jgi:hypothetical protein
MSENASCASASQPVLSEVPTSSATEKEVAGSDSATRPSALISVKELGARRALPLFALRPVPAKVGILDQTRRLRSSPLRSGDTRSLRIARSARALPPLAGHRLCPTARLQRKSAVCGLNGFLPRLCLGSRHLNPRPPKAFGALALWRLFCAVANGNAQVSVLERKIAL